MKTLNYIISMVLAIISPIQMFIIADDDKEFILGFICLITSFIFFLFALIEERNAEISDLRQTILKIKKYYMIE